jgi:integrase
MFPPATSSAGRPGSSARGLSRRTINKLLVNLNGIFTRAHRVWETPNPVRDVERLRERYDPADYDFYAPEEVWALVRAAENETDAALFLTAAFTGLGMGEVLGLRWRDGDFAGESARVERQVNDMGEVTPRKGGLVRSVPMVPEVVQKLAALSQRGWLVGEADPVFPSAMSAKRVNAVMEEVEYAEAQNEILVGGFMDRSALRRRFKQARKRAGLRPLRFHDLRHTFGTLLINAANPVEVQPWLGYQDGRTTQRYLHHKSRAGEAQRIASAFSLDAVEVELERVAS